MDKSEKAELVEETLERIQEDDPDGVRSLLQALLEVEDPLVAQIIVEYSRW